jgi:signal transduction histidine kinase/Co/Zn/Cd efflux system component
MSPTREFSMAWKRLFASAALALVGTLARGRAARPDRRRAARPGRRTVAADLADGRRADPVARSVVRQPPDAKGYAWYLFDWTLREAPDGVYAVYLPGTNVQAQVFVNDTMIGATGELGGRRPQSWERAQAFAIPHALPHEGRNRIAIRVNVPAASFGGLAPIVVGPAVEVRRLAFRDLMLHDIGPALVSVTIIVLGLFILVLWARRRDATYALFGASAILWGVHTLISALPRRRSAAALGIWWHGIYMAFACMLSLFCLRFTGVQWPLYRRVVIAYALGVVPALYLAWLADLVSPAATAIRAGGILIVLVALGAVARYAWQQRNVESALLLLAGAVSAAFAVHDWLAANDPYQIREAWLVPYAALAFLVLVGWILVDRFVRALNAAERSNVELEQRVGEKSAALTAQLARTQEARDAAQAADRAKSRFLAAASHDLRQPLHALGLFAAQLPAHVRDAEGAALAERVRHSVESLDSLLSALLDISKLDAGAIDPRPQALALDALFARIGSDFAPIALERGLKLAIVPTRRVVRSDAVLLERILRNLVDNALKHTTRGGWSSARGRAARRWRSRCTTRARASRRASASACSRSSTRSATSSATARAAWASAWRSCGGSRTCWATASRSPRCRGADRRSASSSRATRPRTWCPTSRRPSRPGRWRAAASWSSTTRPTCASGRPRCSRHGARGASPRRRSTRRSRAPTATPPTR